VCNKTSTHHEDIINTAARKEIPVQTMGPPEVT